MFVRAITAGTARLIMSIMLIACGLAACGREERISLVYTPPASDAVIPGADRVSLDVVVRDQRAQFTDRVGTLRGSSKILVADNDVSELVRGAIAHEFEGQGFVSAAGGLIATVELQNFYCDYSISTVANVAFTIRVRDLAGLTLYSHYYEGTGNDSSGIFLSAASAKGALEQAIGRAVKQVGEDKELQVALLTAKSAMPVRSAISKGQR